MLLLIMPLRPCVQAGFINAIVMPLYKELNRIDGVDISEPGAPGVCSHSSKTTVEVCVLIFAPAVRQLEDNLAEWNERMAAAEAASATATATASS